MIWNRVFVESCASTNDEAARLATAGAPDGTVVVARVQTGGRGRQGRAWHASPGENLTMSCVLRPRAQARDVPAITLAAGIAVHDAVNVFGVRAFLKWPNDVLTAGGKLAGVLTEMSTRANVVEHVILGIGINANTEAFPDELSAIATSMRREIGAPIDLEKLEASVCGELATWLDRFFALGVLGIRDAWQARARLGGRVHVTTDRGTLAGRADHIDDAGCLVVIDDAGGAHRVASGDVVDVASSGEVHP
jgi:BirA family biotin operon repressor/biotin-[acetyl-CoA-carboxylase] ligase